MMVMLVAAGAAAGASLGCAFLQHMQYTKAPTAARNTAPPTAPPTIAPKDELEEAVVEEEALVVAVEAETEVKVAPV